MKKEFIGNLVVRPEMVFIILTLIFGSLSAFLVPQLSVSDENMHFLRSYNLASGKLGNEECIYPADISIKAGSVYEGISSPDYTHKVDFSKNTKATCGSAASYSPIMHLPQAVGMLMAKLTYPSTALIVLLGRLLNVAFYAVAVYYIIKHVRIGKWAFVVIGLFPLMIHMAASLSGDVMSNVLILAVVALIFNLFTLKTKLSRKQILLLFTLICLISLSKVTNVLLLLPLLLLPASSFARNNTSHRLPFSLEKWSIIGLGGIIGVLSMVGWQKVYNVAAPSSPENHLSNPLGFLEILINTYISPFFGYNDLILRGVVGEFASFQYHLPIFMIFLAFFLLFVVMLRRDKKEEKIMKPTSRRLVVGSLSTLCILIMVISYAMYTVWAVQPYRLGPDAAYADGVQGRYFTALLVLLVPLFIWLRRFISVDINSTRRLGLIVFSVSAISLSFYTIETYLFIT